MYVDVELISNNTYQNSIFTYQVSNKLKDKVNIGSIVTVPFRNRDYKAIIVSKSNESLIENPKEIKNFIDYFQRFIVNLIIFKPKKSYKNFLRLISIFLYITMLYAVVYKIWNI